MKTKKTMILGSALGALLTIIIIMALLPKYNQINFMIKHISIFVFLGIVLTTTLFILYKKLFERLQKLSIGNYQIYLKGFTAVVLGFGLYGISVVQFNYIDENETPLLVGCSYYDAWGNELYSNSLPLNCSEPEILESTDNILVVRFKEEYDGPNGTFTMGENIVEGGSLLSSVLVDINIEYENQQIIHYEIKWTQSTKINNALGTRYAYKSLMKVVNNTYSEDNFESVQEFFESEIFSTEIPPKFDSLHEDFSTYTPIKYTIEAGTTDYFLTRNLHVWRLLGDPVSGAVGAGEKALGPLLIDEENKSKTITLGLQDPSSFGIGSVDIVFKDDLLTFDFISNKYDYYDIRIIMNEESSYTNKYDKNIYMLEKSNLYPKLKLYEDANYIGVEGLHNDFYRFDKTGLIRTLRKYIDNSLPNKLNISNYQDDYSDSIDHESYNLYYLDYSSFLFDNYNWNEVFIPHNPIFDLE